jgi:hypothetical protein
MLFAAFSGHELRAAGARAFVESGAAPEPADVGAWLHLGASIATYRFVRDANGRFTSTGRPSDDARLITNTATFEPFLNEAFLGKTIFQPRLVRASAEARGELRLYFEEGYRAFGFEGAHDWMHAPGDLAFVTGPDVLEPVGRSLTETLQALRSAA